MLENARKLRGIYFIDPEDKDFTEIIKNARKNLELPTAIAVPCKRTHSRNGVTCVQKDDHKSKLTCILEADESKRLRKEAIEPRIQEDHVAGKVAIHYIITIWYTNLFLCLKRWNTGSERSSGQRMGKLERISAWNLANVRNQSEVIEETRHKGVKVQFASLMDICHLKNSESEKKHQKYEGRVTHRSDIVEDDSGSCAVFTEQGSSASLMTAAKVMDIVSRLPGCAGHAADAVSSYTQVKMEDAPELLKNFKNRSVQTFGYVYNDTNGLNHGPVWKIQSFLLNEICSVILC